MATIQGLYLALFGRPADPAGLAYFSNLTKGGADLSAIGDLTATPEYQGRFTGMNNAQIVGSIFTSLFGRPADQEGLAFFVEELSAGRKTINTIAISILDGPKGQDISTLDEKLKAAEFFTALLDESREIGAYVGDAAAKIGRDYIASIPAKDAATTQNAKFAVDLLFPTSSTSPGTSTGPVFTSGAAVSVFENIATSAVVYDADATSTGGSVTFTLSGADASSFSIDANTGEVKFLASPDYAAPADTGADNIYNVIVTATDSTAVSTTRAVAITVMQQDNVAPVFTSGTTASMVENAATSTTVYTAAATDTVGPVSYTLGGADAALFSLDSTTGVLKFLASPDYEAPADAGGNNVYDVVVTATDGASNTATRSVAVTITNVDDTAPVFTSGTTVSKAENTLASTTIYTAIATDATGPVTYSLGGTDAAFFSLDATTGVLKFLASPDYEAPADAGGNNVYDVVITATDGASNAATRSVAVTITDVDDAAPVFTSATMVSVIENTLTTGYTAAATDATGPVTYSLSGTDAALFTLNATSGVLKFLTGRDYENPGDADGDNVYDVTIEAKDGANNTATQNLAVTVIDAAVESVAVTVDNVPANGTSSLSMISANGRYIVFQSTASNLVANDTNGAVDVFVRDLQTGAIQRVSLADASAQIATASNTGSISDDGRYVVFTSSNTNIVPGDTNGWGDTFLHDTVTGSTQRVNVHANGTQSDRPATSGAISADGNYAVFATAATTLVTGVGNGTTTQLFVRDIQNSVTEIVSVNSSEVVGNGHSGASVFDISATGNYVVFASSATNLSEAADTNARNDIFIRDRAAGTTKAVSVNAAGAGATGSGGASDAPSVSADGRYVAFHSSANDLVAGDTNGIVDVFVRDMQAGTTERISVSTSGTQSNGDSSWARISDDGRFVVFHSQGSNLVANDTNGGIDVFVRDMVNHKTIRVSLSDAGAQVPTGVGTLGSQMSISGDGRFITFESDTNGLAPTGAGNDVFVVDGLKQGWWFV